MDPSLSPHRRIRRPRAPLKVRERSGTNRDWLADRARELGIRPAPQMRYVRVRSMRTPA